MLALLLPLALAQTADPPKPADPNRWEKDIAAIEKRLKDEPPRPGGVMFVGSSSIVKWKLEDSFPHKGYVNVGFGGSRIPDNTRYAPRIVFPHKPGTVVFYAGDNDVGGGATPEQVSADFEAFAAALHKELPQCRLVFVAVKPSPKRWAKFDQQQKVNGLIKELSAKDPRIAFVDIVPDMLGSDGKPKPELYLKDDLHMTPAGYALWAPKVAAALLK